MTETEQSLLDYIQSAYPLGLRGSTRDETSLIWKYDFVRAAMLAVEKSSLEDGIIQMAVQTATSVGLTEWENFLYIPVNPELSDVLRRTTILSKLAGSNPTITTIKAVVQSIVGGDAEAFTITERWKVPGSTADEVWDYTVDIYAPNTGAWSSDNLVALLESIQPAHCQVTVNIIPPLADALGIEDSVTYGIHNTFIWGDSGAPLGTDSVWGSDATPLVGPIWS